MGLELSPKLTLNPATAKPEKQNPTIWEVASSWYLLPEVPMRPRYFDNRVGFFATTVNDYTRTPDRAIPTTFVNRWRLESRKEDMEKYHRGELVEPEKPIVFYIDKATPEYLRPYLIEAVNAWQPVFEKAGFKNAIMGKLAPTPEENPEFSIEDARYSVISYKASPIPNAYGPHVADPRVAFGTEIDPEGPRFQAEDLSDNTIAANVLGVKNLKETMRHIEEWTASGDDEDYSLLKSMYTAVVHQYWLFVNHALKFVGGRYCDASLRSEQMDFYVPVPKEKQLEAMNYLKTYLFTDQQWLFDNHAEQVTGFGGSDYKRRAVANIYAKLLGKAPNLIKHEGLLGSNKVYTLKEHIDFIYHTAFGSLASNKPLTQFERDKQAEYVKAILKVLGAPTIETMPALAAQLTPQLDKIARECRRRAAVEKNSLSRNHLQGLAYMIDEWKKEK